MDEVYHQYILYGVMNSFQYYAQQMKDEPSEENHAILDNYVSSCLTELHAFWSSILNQEKMQMEVSPMMNMMLSPIAEPTEADIFEEDIFKLQKGERQKVPQLKKQLRRISREIKSDKKAASLQISHIMDVKAAKGKSLKDQLEIDPKVIESKHNMELEVLVRFLLEIKIEDSTKFKKVVKSFMNVLASDETDAQTKQSTLQILRKLSNFKDNPEIYESIQDRLLEPQPDQFLQLCYHKQQGMKMRRLSLYWV